MLSGALRQMFALSESYPDLKANANFQQLQAEADRQSRTSSRPLAAFSSTNAVQEYNTGIQNFPAVLFRGARSASMPKPSSTSAKAARRPKSPRK